MLGLIGINYKNTPINIREIFSISKSNLSEVLNLYFKQFNLSECIILSTCNRFEIYFFINPNLLNLDNFLENTILFFLKYHNNYSDIDILNIKKLFYIKFNEEVANHLFNVSLGLDSMVIGENQILSQIKFAYETAHKLKTTNYILNKLFNQTIKLSKKVRTQTKIDKFSVSLSGIAVNIIKKEYLNCLDKIKILLIGSGETACLVLLNLIKAGIKNYVVTSRTLNNAKKLAKTYNANVIDIANLYDNILNFDVIISSTDAPHFIITHDKYVSKINSNNKNHLKQLLIDLAVPRDIDPKLNSLEHIKLYNIDDLAEFAKENIALRENEALKAKELIDKELKIFLDWYKNLDIKHFIENFYKHIENIIDNEFLRFEKKISSDFTIQHKKIIDNLKSAIINKICILPIKRAQTCSQNKNINECIKKFECFFYCNNINCNKNIN